MLIYINQSLYIFIQSRHKMASQTHASILRQLQLGSLLHMLQILLEEKYKYFKLLIGNTLPVFPINTRTN